jgi:nucleotide-binding universal stress UspA family protein
MNSPVAAVSISLRNILFPTDFSPCAETALAYAAGLARRFNSTLHTVTVVSEEIVDYVQPPDPFYLRHTAEKKMSNLTKLELLQGVRHRESVKEGVVLETLAELIGRLEIDLIVLGTHGRDGVKKVMLGSVAEKIVNSALCPVLTVGPHAPRLLGPHSRLHSVLCATDLLHKPSKTLAYASWLAEQDQGRLILLHVIQSTNNFRSGDPASEIKSRKKDLAQLLPSDSAVSVEAECIVEMGTPADQILRVAENRRADLIVMGPSHTALTRLSARLPWITPHKVICYAPCPVLTVRC